MGKGMGMGPQKKVKLSGGGNNEMRWKEHLHNTLMKKNGGTVDEKPTYEVEGESGGKGKFKCTVTIDGATYTSGEEPSKKAAEHAAAKAAMKAKFYKEFKMVTESIEFESMMQTMGGAMR